MPRTTVRIDGPVLRDLKKLKKREKKPLGQLISELLARALSELAVARPRAHQVQWISRPMKARVELTDKDALWRALERDEKRD